MDRGILGIIIYSDNYRAALCRRIWNSGRSVGDTTDTLWVGVNTLIVRCCRRFKGVVGGIRDWRYVRRRMAVELRRRVRLYSIILPLSSVYSAALVVVLRLGGCQGSSTSI